MSRVPARFYAQTQEVGSVVCNQLYMINESGVSKPFEDYLVAEVTTAAEREAVFLIRMVVFVEEQSVPPEEELDTYDLTAAHFLVRRTYARSDELEAIIATARLVDYGGGTGKVGRVAVLREHRGLGVGALLMRYVEATARNLGFTQLILEDSYRRLLFMRNSVMPPKETYSLTPTSNID